MNKVAVAAQSVSTSALLTSIAALFLATGTAHAQTNRMLFLECQGELEMSFPAGRRANKTGEVSYGVVVNLTAKTIQGGFLSEHDEVAAPHGGLPQGQDHELSITGQPVHRSKSRPLTSGQGQYEPSR